MRRLHRYKQVRARCESAQCADHEHEVVDQGLEDSVIDPGAERRAAIEQIERDRVAALAALGVVADEVKHS